MKPLRIVLKPVLCASLNAIGYDRDSQTLDVQFASGRVDRFSNVPPEEVRLLRNAASITQYFERHIRRKFPSVDLESLDLHEGSTAD